MKMKIQSATAALAAAAVCSTALAGYTITQGSTAPTYSDRMLNFDEPGGPQGVVPADSWASLGLIEMQAGDGIPVVADNDTPNGSWGLGDGLSFFGSFGVFMTFDTGLNAMSLEVWDPSGPPSPFGGGLAVILFNDGNKVGFMGGTPAWGGVGDTWWHITADAGQEFDEVRILGFGFPFATYVDNLSWNRVPAPGSAALLGLPALALLRRRR